MRILAPVDFSDRSLAALRYAKAWASRGDSQIIVLHAMPIPHYEGGWAMAGEAFSGRRTTIEGDLSEMMDQELEGIAASQVVVEGDASLAIIDYAIERHPDLIIMPTHGYGPFRQFFLGSTTVRVLEQVDVPVLTGAHMGAEDETGIKNVICALDLGAGSKGALEWAARTAKLFGARLFLVHAMDGLGAPTDEEYFDAPVEAGNEALARLETLKSELGVEAIPIVTGGEPVAAVLRQAGELSADLLVIGRGAVREGLKRRMRARSQRLIREAMCPVLSV